MVTTLPAPTMAFFPITTFDKIVAPEPIEAPFSTRVSFHFPVCFGLQAAAFGGSPRIGIVDEGHAVSDEDVVFDLDAFADEGVARDLAIRAHTGIFLNLDEGPDLGVVPDRATVEIDELGQLDAFPQLDAGSNRKKLFHGDVVTHSCLAILVRKSGLAVPG